MTAAIATYTFSNLEQSRAWQPMTGASIAPNPPEGKFIEYESDGMRLTTVSSLQWAGWLAKFSLQLPPLPPKFTASLALDISVDDAVGQAMQALELDTMFAMSDRRVGNTSFEYNLNSGGHAQIVNSAYHWTDIGFNPGPLPVETRIPFLFNYAYDQAAGLSSVTSVSIGGVFYAVPPAMQGIPFQSLNWDPNKMIIQIQSNMVQGGGACSFKVLSCTATVSHSL